MSKMLKDYKGAIHIHSSYSDGSGSLKEITEAANGAGLDYIIITDHHTLRHRQEGAEGWHGNTLVLVGEEISPKSNHYIALNIKKAIHPEGMQAQDYINEVNRQGGMGFVVHPDSPKKRTLPLKERPWSNWEAKDFTGLELWSYMYDWLLPVHLFNAPYYLAHPEKAITGPSESALKRWDELTQKRRVVATGGVDAHARVIIPGILKVFPYEQLFATIRTHILTPPFEHDNTTDPALVYSAIRQGHLYISYDYLADASGLTFGARSGNEEVVMGDEIKLSPGLVLSGTSPHKAELRFIRNGKLFKEAESKKLEMNLSEPGIYRMEVTLGGKAWVFTNPVYVR